MNLETLSGADFVEVWYANGDVASGVDGAIRCHRRRSFPVGRHRSRRTRTTWRHPRPPPRLLIEPSRDSRRTRGSCIVLRTWNYFDAINQRCAATRSVIVSSARGEWRDLDGMPQAQYPAATVIGRRDGDPRSAGVLARGPVAQGSRWRIRGSSPAYQLPAARYGQTPPSFSRGCSWRPAR